MDDREFSSPVCYLKEEDFFDNLTEPEPKVLCRRCQGALNSSRWDKSKDIDGWSDHEFDGCDGHGPNIPYRVSCTYSNLKDAAAKGCPLCSMLLGDHLTPSARIQLEQEPGCCEHANPSVEAFELTVQYRYGISPRKINMCLYREKHELEVPSDVDPEDDREFLGSQSILLIPCDELDPNLSKEESLGCSTASESSAKTSLNWMMDCVKNHHKCQQPSKFLPTRLIDVGLGQFPNPRLVLGSNLLPGTRYVTLSHCWGSQVPKKLLKASLSSMMKAICVTELSKTFQDAFIVARKLGQRYLWIDALCIVQDDFADWQEESSCMSEVYLRSICNISASAASNGSDGLFNVRDPTPMKSYRVFLHHSCLYYLVDTFTWKDSIEDAPLNKRAWVCQERILSPCNLHFGRQQLFWECRELSASEIFPCGIPKDSYSEVDAKQHISKSLVDYSDVDDHSVHLEFARKSWDRLLMKYTSSKLTHSKDKLVAFAGLAALWARISQDRYIAGLWGRDLYEQLLWNVVPRDDHVDREYTAPSWSWAAVDGPVTPWVNPDPAHSKLLVDSVEATVILDGQSPFGKVKGGSLTLNGALAFAELEVNDNSLEYGETFIFRSDKARLKCHYACTLDMTPITFRKAEKSDLGGQHSKELYLLPVFYSPRDELDWRNGLLLKRTGHKVAEFRRVGTFVTYADGDEPDNIQHACQYFDTRAPSMGLESFTDVDGQLKYKIIIV